MTRTLAWCLTAFNKPDQHLYGPFATRALAQREAMRLLGHEAKLWAAERLRMPATLVPTPCNSLCRQPTVYAVVSSSSQGAGRVSHPRVATSTVPSPPVMAIYRLTEGKLRYMAAQLGIALPATAATRASIIDILLKELDLL